MSLAGTREIETACTDSLPNRTEDAAPAKCDVFGVALSLAGPQEVVDCVMRWAHTGRGAVVNFMPVHGLIEARKPERRGQIDTFDINACDGQPVRWAMNFFHKAKLDQRVYGPEAMAAVCQRAAIEDVGIYLYGGSPKVIETLTAQLPSRYPGLKIVGATSPPFRALSPEEDQQAIDAINASGAGVVFLGLGCPKQDLFAYEHRKTIQAVQMCVGAAFDFHAGMLQMAPPWMQKRGLEWLYRLYKEPRRLWKRYVITNSTFVFLFIRRMILGR